MYEIYIEHQAEKDYKKLRDDVAERITNYILELAENPRPRGIRKLQAFDNVYRIRVGDYRVIFDIDDKNKIIRIFKVRHRKDVYK